MLYAIGIKLRVGYLKIDNSIYLHCNVILGDNGLRRKVRNLFLEGHDLCNPLDERYLDMQTHVPRSLIGAEKLNDISLCLLYNADVLNKNKQYDQDKNNRYNKFHNFLLFI